MSEVASTTAPSDGVVRREGRERRDTAVIVYERVLPAVPTSVARIRGELGEALAALGVPGRRREDIALAVAEAPEPTVGRSPPYAVRRPGEMMVAVKVDLAHELTMVQLARAVNAAERWVGDAVPRVRAVYLERDRLTSVDDERTSHETPIGEAPPVGRRACAHRHTSFRFIAIPGGQTH